MKLNKKSLKNTLYAAGFGVLGIVNTYGQTPMKTTTTKYAPSTYQISDMNNDGFADKLTMTLSKYNFNQKGTLELSLNNTKGKFQQKKKIASFNSIYEEGIQILIGDFNNDSHKDIYLVLTDSKDKVEEYYFQGDGKGNFTNKTSFN